MSFKCAVHTVQPVQQNQTSAIPIETEIIHSLLIESKWPRKAVNATNRIVTGRPREAMMLNIVV